MDDPRSPPPCERREETVSLHRVVLTRGSAPVLQRSLRRAALIILSLALCSCVLLLGMRGAAGEGSLVPLAQMESLCGGSCPIVSGWTSNRATAGYWVPGMWVWESDDKYIGAARSKSAAARRIAQRAKHWGTRTHGDYIDTVHGGRYIPDPAVRHHWGTKQHKNYAEDVYAGTYTPDARVVHHWGTRHHDDYGEEVYGAAYEPEPRWKSHWGARRHGDYIDDVYAQRYAPDAVPGESGGALWGARRHNDYIDDVYGGAYHPDMRLRYSYGTRPHNDYADDVYSRPFVSWDAPYGVQPPAKAGAKGTLLSKGPWERNVATAGRTSDGDSSIPWAKPTWGSYLKHYNERPNVVHQAGLGTAANMSAVPPVFGQRDGKADWGGQWKWVEQRAQSRESKAQTQSSDVPPVFGVKNGREDWGGHWEWVKQGGERNQSIRSASIEEGTGFESAQGAVPPVFGTKNRREDWGGHWAWRPIGNRVESHDEGGRWAVIPSLAEQVVIEPKPDQATGYPVPVSN